MSGTDQDGGSEHNASFSVYVSTYCHICETEGEEERGGDWIENDDDDKVRIMSNVWEWVKGNSLESRFIIIPFI